MSILTFKVSTDARCIYLYGTRSFSEETEGYVIPIQQYAAKTFSRSQIDDALAKGWIMQEQYDATICYVSSDASSV